MGIIFVISFRWHANLIKEILFFLGRLKKNLLISFFVKLLERISLAFIMMPIFKPLGMSNVSKKDEDVYAHGPR